MVCVGALDLCCSVLDQIKKMHCARFGPIHDNLIFIVVVI